MIFQQVSWHLTIFCGNIPYPRMEFKITPLSFQTGKSVPEMWMQRFFCSEYPLWKYRHDLMCTIQYWASLQLMSLYTRKGYMYNCISKNQLLQHTKMQEKKKLKPIYIVGINYAKQINKYLILLDRLIAMKVVKWIDFLVVYQTPSKKNSLILYESTLRYTL